MKITTEYRRQSRRSLDKRVLSLKPFEHLFEIPSGWLKATRESLGISSRALEARLKISSGSVVRAEQREKEGNITLNMLRVIAAAMECKLVYAFLPLGKNQTFESILEQRAKILAEQILREVSHTMKLEAQSVDLENSEQERKKLVATLMEKLDARLWETKN
ncbi:MAG: hypothetical protein EOO87_00135 [Pedobacter sp.]|nr:MAG: hypothetical protein EOO87_00135 [Pedobacter sp.]